MQTLNIVCKIVRSRNGRVGGDGRHHIVRIGIGGGSGLDGGVMGAGVGTFGAGSGLEGLEGSGLVLLPSSKGMYVIVSMPYVWKCLIVSRWNLIKSPSRENFLVPLGIVVR